MEPDSYSQIGALLRTARNERALTLPQASRLLHIRVRYLEALEQGRLAELPGVAYSKGYLQAYAAFLGLDKEEILRRFEQVDGLLGKKGFYLPQVFSKEKTAPAWAVWGGLLAALAVWLVWCFALQPPHAAISVVENFHRPSVEIAGSGACFQPQAAYYPPCTVVRGGLFPLLRSVNSVMELAR